MPRKDTTRFQSAYRAICPWNLIQDETNMMLWLLISEVVFYYL